MTPGVHGTNRLTDELFGLVSHERRRALTTMLERACVRRGSPSQGTLGS